MELRATAGFQAVTRPTAPTTETAQAQRSAAGAPAERSGGPGDGVRAGAQSSGAPFISPVLRYDQTAQLAVLLFRDDETGETREQIPAERVVEEYRRNGGRQLGDLPDGERGDRASGAGVTQVGSSNFGQTAATPPTAGGAGFGAESGTATSGAGAFGVGSGGGPTGLPTTGIGTTGAGGSGAGYSGSTTASAAGSGVTPGTGGRISVTV